MTRRKGFIALPILIFVAAVAVGVALYFSGYFGIVSKKDTTADDVLVQNADISTGETVSSPLSPELVEGLPAGWQTYRNEKYGFEVRYPSAWSYAPIESRIGFYPSNKKPNKDLEYVGDVLIETLSNPKSLSLKNYYLGSIFTASEKQTPLTVNGFEAYRFDGVYGMVPSTVVSIRKGNVIVELTNFDDTVYGESLFDQILSTFKFIP